MLSQDQIARLSAETQARWIRYNNLRGKLHGSIEFWDIVVLTAIDKEQKNAYELQLQSKLSFKELPLSCTYLVMADPPGPKIGNGGSTLFVIDELFRMFGEKLFHKKVIIVHGGGFSQRLPSASILGKIFVGIPIGEPMYQSLDLKLATYIDFPSKVKAGGIFVCSADTFEVYDDCGEPWEFHSEGFTGLAHLSPVTIGRTHGVYVLKQPSATCKMLWRSSKFLHKPSIDTMEKTDHCVVLKGNDEMWVMTDSAFFISPGVVKVLLEFYQRNSPLSCEIDAYGDFLQASGDDSTPNYTTNVDNVCDEAGSLIETRRTIYDLLKGTPLYALLLAPSPYFCENIDTQSEASSIFYHIGTMPEFITNFCHDATFRRIFGVQTLLSSHGLPYLIKTESSNSEKSSLRIGGNGAISCKVAEVELNPPSIMRSLIKPLVTIGNGSIIEYSIIGTGCVIGNDSIVSGCCVPKYSIVPEQSFHHTIPITVNDQKLYITVAFQTNANMKKSMPTKRALDEIIHFGLPLGKFLGSCSDSTTSLWKAKMFPAATTMEKSFQQTTQSIRHPELLHKLDLFSMNDALRMRDLSRAISHRDYLSTFSASC